MLAIRLQRTGRKGHAQFRVVVQDARLSPSSGRVVTRLGSYNPHTKTAVIDTEKAKFYLDHGAQPSDRIALLFQKEGVKLPKWVSQPGQKQRTTRNPEKYQKQGPTPAAEEPVVDEETPAADTPADTETSETTEVVAETEAAPVEETIGQDVVAETSEEASSSAEEATAGAEEKAATSDQKAEAQG